MRIFCGICILKMLVFRIYHLNSASCQPNLHLAFATSVRISIQNPAISHEMSEAQDRFLYKDSEIWQTPRQHRCRDACQISDQYDDFNTSSRGSEISLYHKTSYCLVSRCPGPSCPALNLLALSALQSISANLPWIRRAAFRLLNSPSVLAAELPLAWYEGGYGTGYETRTPLPSAADYLIGWSKYRLGALLICTGLCVSCNALWIQVTVRNFHW